MALQKERLDGLFSAIDRKDADDFVSFLSENASFRFANAPAVRGRSSIHGAVSQFFSAVKELRHDVSDAWESGDTVICEGEVTYVRHNDTTLTVPFANVFRMEDGAIAEYRIYADVSALFSS